ncbi:hypothetical protein O1Y80_004829, partial [Yersinia enterocolitica]|nr:hypothetical protein [Yersinia enterocolitica]
LTREDELTIEQYIRIAHNGYTGPVFIWLDRLKELHMKRAQLIAWTAITCARYESRKS